MSSSSYIVENLSAVKRDVALAEQAAARAGKTRMLAAVKYGTDEEIAALLDAGVTEIGENRVQQLLAHWPLYEVRGTRVHFIGTLQTNKVKYIADKVCMIHSVDSPRLAEVIQRAAVRCDRVIDVLVEINGADEAAKSGVAPNEVEALCRAILSHSNLRLCGFMTMGPRFEDAEGYRAYFASVKACGDAVWQALSLAGEPLYSMGMSESVVPAIHAGADLVRVGRRLFAGRELTETNSINTDERMNNDEKPFC